MSLADLRRDLSVEVLDIAETADGLQHLMGELVVRAGVGADARLLEEAQAYDRMVQRLFRLAKALADTEAPFSEVPRSLAKDDPAAGDCDLF